ncbi:hypothetical protein SAMN02787118_11126 [Streptomyces mirabilis]|jgi:hypothetical protein|uniref:Uncharacterized protein n=1 Tax=Streptomyces mirabilis TaxID=68239 RepID=A0A1I2KXL4_9ACTN|nr:hypothetical protein SAMN02787118_11126 [Streptomyces mirabilis]
MIMWRTDDGVRLQARSGPGTASPTGVCKTVTRPTTPAPATHPYRNRQTQHSWTVTC